MYVINRSCGEIRRGKPRWDGTIHNYQIEAVNKDGLIMNVYFGKTVINESKL